MKRVKSVYGITQMNIQSALGSLVNVCVDISMPIHSDIAYLPTTSFCCFIVVFFLFQLSLKQKGFSVLQLSIANRQDIEYKHTMHYYY